LKHGDRDNPLQFREVDPAEQEKIVPICLTRRDRQGNKIAWGWFEATARIQNPLISLARRILRDPWRASEIADSAVHSVWDLHGEDMGRKPESRVYAQAQWCALDLQAGTQRERRGRTVALDDLDESIRKRALVDPADYDSRYMAGIQLSELSRRLDAIGRPDIKLMLNHLRNGCNWDEVGSLTEQTANTAQRRFWRWIKRILDSLNDEGPASEQG
jgi:hypothetical protein